MELNWKYFTGAAVIVGVALLPFAPLRPILMGIVIACGAQWILQRRFMSTAAGRQTSAEPSSSSDGSETTLTMMQPSRLFLRGCLIVALLLAAAGRVRSVPGWLVGAEVIVTIALALLLS
jgi:hypothetical protein